MPVRWFCWVTSMLCVCNVLLLNIGLLKDFQWKLFVLIIHKKTYKQNCLSVLQNFLDKACVHILWLCGIVEFEISFYCPSNNDPQENILLFYNCDVTNDVCALICIRKSPFFKRKQLKEILLERGKLPLPLGTVKCGSGGGWKEDLVTSGMK